jgi:hypothetical protein
MSYFVGQMVRLSGAFTVGDVATDPTAVSLVVEAPDGTETTYTYAGGTITKDGTGAYHKDISATMGGVWKWRWVGTGAVAAADQDAFVVESSNV